MITAAGGIVFDTIDGKRRLLVIHRPSYDDWSLPKGKHDDDNESDEEAALREIEEETGVVGRIVSKLTDIEYTTSNDNAKRVTYFGVRAVKTPKFRPNSEVDRVEWLSTKAALKKLTYRHDRRLVERNPIKHLDALGQVHLVRHAAAGDRFKWKGDDRLRPLTKKGVAQSEAIADFMAPRLASSILSSPYVRCVETAEPLASRLGMKVEPAEFLEEGSRGRGLLDHIEERPGAELVMVSHGDVIPAIIDKLSSRGVPLASNDPTGVLDCKKGSIWTLNTEKGVVTSAVYQPPPKI